MKCAIFCCRGLGDGLITLVLSNNLKRHGHEVDTFHPFLSKLQPFFPNLPIHPFPKDPKVLQDYDKVFIIYEKSPEMQAIMDEAPNDATILNPIATPNRDYPFWEQGKFDGNQPFVDNLVTFCKETLKLDDPTKDNGIVLPFDVDKKPNRVILHPMSSRLGKNWTKGKYIRLSSKLKKAGYDPVFILTKEEKELWPEVKAPVFEDLADLVHFVAESSWMIGNDSGIGHLASCLGVPTLTICRSQLAANFWRPAWAPGEVIVPPRGIPNLKGMRLRDKKWQLFVPVGKVFKTFQKLTTFSI